MRSRLWGCPELLFELLGSRVVRIQRQGPPDGVQRAVSILVLRSCHGQPVVVGVGRIQTHGFLGQQPGLIELAICAQVKFGQGAEPFRPLGVQLLHPMEGTFRGIEPFQPDLEPAQKQKIQAVSGLLSGKRLESRYASRRIPNLQVERLQG